MLILFFSGQLRNTMWFFVYIIHSIILLKSYFLLYVVVFTVTQKLHRLKHYNDYIVQFLSEKHSQVDFLDFSLCISPGGIKYASVQ